jgi:hypothetical protein
VVDTWAYCGMGDMVVRRLRVTRRPPTLPNAVAVDFFSTLFKPLFLLVVSKVEVPPLEVEVELIHDLVDSDFEGAPNTKVGPVVVVALSYAILD